MNRSSSATKQITLESQSSLAKNELKKSKIYSKRPSTHLKNRKQSPMETPILVKNTQLQNQRLMSTTEVTIPVQDDGQKQFDATSQEDYSVPVQKGKVLFRSKVKQSNYSEQFYKARAKKGQNPIYLHSGTDSTKTSFINQNTTQDNNQQNPFYNSIYSKHNAKYSQSSSLKNTVQYNHNRMISLPQKVKQNDNQENARFREFEKSFQLLKLYGNPQRLVEQKKKINLPNRVTDAVKWESKHFTNLAIKANADLIDTRQLNNYQHRLTQEY